MVLYHRFIRILKCPVVLKAAAGERFRIGKRAFEHGGKGECARINAYMQKHFNDILSFLSRFLTVRIETKTLLLSNSRTMWFLGPFVAIFPIEIIYSSVKLWSTLNLFITSN